ncbi:MAG: triose-phosphate isomerase [Rhodospirillales bacterium]
MRLVAGNWKMNGTSDLARELAAGLAERVAASAPACSVVICPPAPLLGLAQASAAGRVALGGQDCSDEAGPGAFTGEVSARMLADAGCGYVIVGHSERRQRHGEESALVQAKAARALEAGLVPIICVGETLAQREAGQAVEVVSTQVRESLPEAAAAQTVVLAYEPVWAIGSGLTATLADIAEIHRAVGAVLGPIRARTAILYGGSVKPANAREILTTEGVDGALVGGASLKLDDFWGIVAAA